MIDGTQIKEHMEVVSRDGHHVGRVDHVKGNEIELAKFDFGAGLKHHLIPMSWVEDVRENEVRINRTADDAKSQWREVH
ncbi:DUF2171 domain-containing protein [Phenylobacterium montanum]|uniref:DUF2171 domain-containing protein n=1 Tax=Phenylobacterium montanum TaxID=2823693 RepID=A0A975G3R1_9CAUL|nr:DUF2171 domain-containing protein [Caulobacter sp. S6]QUD90022.1 DUF2171 domain-containing protein [Caulobacter sp. S6]